jgi:hypothetical protein
MMIDKGIDTMYTYSDELISDLHKDARGFRPHEAFYEGWTQSDDDNKQAIWDGLCREMKRREEEEARTEAYLVEKFEEEVLTHIDNGAGDCQTALRWMTQNVTFYHSQDIEHWVYNQGILFTDYGRELVKELEKIVEFNLDWE